MSDEHSNAPRRPTASSHSEIIAWMDYTCAELIERRNELLTALKKMLRKDGKAHIKDGDDETAAVFAENVRMAEHLLKQMDAVRVREKAPFLEGTRAVDGYKHMFALPLEPILAELNRAQLAWSQRKAEAARKIREAEAREQRERALEAQRDAEAALRQKNVAAAEEALERVAQTARDATRAEQAAQGSVADLGAVRSAFTGKRTAPKTFWRWELADLAELLHAVINGEVSIDAICVNEAWVKERAIIRDPVTNRPVEDIPGIRWVEEHRLGRAVARV